MGSFRVEIYNKLAKRLLFLLGFIVKASCLRSKPADSHRLRGLESRVLASDKKASTWNQTNLKHDGPRSLLSTPQYVNA